MESKHEVDQEARLAATERMLGIVDQLRDPGGCPWDRKQSIESMAPHAVEEVHELREAIEAGDNRAIAEEAGDSLMGIAMILRIGSEAGRFDWTQACNDVSDKLVRRHPHVFADGQAETAGEVLETWEEIKKAERAERESDASALAGVPKTLPALHRATRMCEKSRAAGFAWNSVRCALRKVTEEAAELEEAYTVEGGEELSDRARRHVEHELGDVLMAAAFFGQYLGMDPERLCNRAIDRYEARFRHMEAEVGPTLKQYSFDELMRAWDRAKGATKTRDAGAESAE